MNPTLEEVKEYFKNAKEVECLGDGEIIDLKYMTDKGIHEWLTSFWIDYKNHPNIADTNNSCLLFIAEKGYAKIISYKEPTYKITKETVLKYNMKDEFPECFKVNLEAGKWYKHTYGGLTFIKEINRDEITSYGFYNNMEWYDKEVWKLSILKSGMLIDTTDKEVQEALEKEAVNMGLYSDKPTSYVYSNGKGYLNNPIKNKFIFKNGILYLWDIKIFENGQWANILPTLTIKEAEEKLNCKIV